MLIFLMGSLLILSTASSFGEVEDCRCWTPSKDQIAQFEKSDLNGLPASPDHYRRYYVGRLAAALPAPRRNITAVFVALGPGESGSVNILSDGKLPVLTGEGCLTSPWRRDQVYFRCTSPGGWLPTDNQIAQLERDLILPPHTGRLTAYARHYAGITDKAGKQVIRAVFVAPSSPFDFQPGIYIASDAEIPIIADGGCGVVSATYDPQLNMVTSIRCNGVA